MNDNNRKLKTLVFSVGLVLGTMMPKMAQAQFGSGMLGYGRDAEQQSRESLFRNGTNQGAYNIGSQHFGDDVFGGFNIGTQQFGEEAPLGSGWLVLTIAGVSYAFRKRKNNNK